MAPIHIHARINIYTCTHTNFKNLKLNSKLSIEVRKTENRQQRGSRSKILLALGAMEDRVAEDMSSQELRPTREAGTLAVGQTVWLL